MIGGLLLPFITPNGSTSQYTTDAVTAGIRLLIASVGFWIWFRIFSFVRTAIEIRYKGGSSGLDFGRLAILMFIAFAFDLVDFLFRIVIEPDQPVSSAIPMIDLGQPFFARMFLHVLSPLKVSAYLGPFITPRTFGLSTLFIAAILFLDSRKEPATRKISSELSLDGPTRQLRWVRRITIIIGLLLLAIAVILAIVTVGLITGFIEDPGFTVA